jgi:ATP-binding cassette subfamily C protein LapB
VLSLVERIIVVDNGRIVVDDTKDNAIARLSQPGDRAPQSGKKVT